jgi:hypothetical protein
LDPESREEKRELEEGNATSNAMLSQLSARKGGAVLPRASFPAFKTSDRGGVQKVYLALSSSHDDWQSGSSSAASPDCPKARRKPCSREAVLGICTCVYGLEELGHATVFRPAASATARPTRCQHYILRELAAEQTFKDCTFRVVAAGTKALLLSLGRLTLRSIRIHPEDRVQTRKAPSSVTCTL